MGATAPARRPTAWFDPEVAAELLGGAVRVEHHTLAFTAESADAWLAEQEVHHPVWRMAVRALPAEAWSDIRAESVLALEAHNVEADAFRVESPYVTVVRDA